MNLAVAARSPVIVGNAAVNPSEQPNTDSRLTTLQRGLEQLKLPASLTTQKQLLAYLDMLLKWNRHFNLTAVRDVQAMLPQHLLDCLAILPAIDRHVQQHPVRILDVGSGAGLPGVVLAAMRPDWSVTCVDAVAKKAGFIRQVAAELPLPNLYAEHARVEQLKLPAFDVVVSRAFASLADFVRCSREQLAPAGCWLAMKGRLPDDESAALPDDVALFHVEQLVVPGLSAQRCLVWMRPT